MGEIGGGFLDLCLAFFMKGWGTAWECWMYLNAKLGECFTEKKNRLR